MSRTRTIWLDPPLVEAIAAYRTAEATYVPGRDSASLVELPKLAVADAFLATVERTERLPHRARPLRVTWSLRRRKRA